MITSYRGCRGDLPVEGLPLDVERHLDRYLVYDTDQSAHDEVWSCSTLAQLYDWLELQGVDLAEFEETVPGAGSGEAWESD